MNGSLCYTGYVEQFVLNVCPGGGLTLEETATGVKEKLFFFSSSSLFLLFEGLFSVLLKEKTDNACKTFMCVKHKQKK